jgi:hypothetical protein
MCTKKKHIFFGNRKLIFFVEIFDFFLSFRENQVFLILDLYLIM